MTDIILIYPRTGFDIKNVSIEFPLSVIHISSLLHQQGYNIKIIDQRTDKQWEETLKRELKNNPLFVGISTMTGTQIYHGLIVAKIVREHSSVPLVWGGVHPTILPINTLENEFVDIVVKGDGERTILNVAQALENNTSLADVKGICYKDPKTKKIINNPEQAPEDINNFPDVPYHLIDVKEYLKNNGGLFSTMYSKGCPFGCGFCCNPLISKRRWRTVKAERIVADIEYNHSKYHFKKLRFNDENFFVDADRVEKISKAINNAYEWECQARIDSAPRFDFNALKKRGLYQIQPGIESGNDRILKLINKGITKQQIIDYNRMLAKSGIITTYNFMMGFPTETVPEIYESIDLSMQLFKENPNAEISAFYIYVPYPGCDLYDLSIKEGFVPPTKLEEWAVFSRQQLHTPWIQNNIGMMKNIALTSKFIDGKRMARLFKKTPIPGIAPQLLAKIYQRRWRKKDFKNYPDIKMVNFAASKVVKIF